MIEQERLEELIPLYALGVLEGEELREVEGIIGSGEPEVIELLRDYENVVSMMSYSTPGVEPDPGLKKKLVEEIRATRNRLKRSQTKNPPVPIWKRLESLWLGLGGAVAAAVVVVLFISNLSLRGKIDDRTALVTELNERVSSQEAEIETVRESLAIEKTERVDLQVEIAELEDLTSFLDDPDVIIVKLTDRSPEYDPVGRVHWDKEDDEALFVSLNLPEAPSGKTYQWWIVADGIPKSAGIFKVGKDGKSLMKIGPLSDFGNIQNFLLTLESEGGARQPTGDMFLSGESL